MMVIFFDLIEKVMELFMDDFSIYGKTAITHSEKAVTKPPYVCLGCSNHTYNNNMINSAIIQSNCLLHNDPWV
jgi:hypothetical protein